MLLWPCALLAGITAAIAMLEAGPESALRHAYLLPTLWAAVAAGARGGGVIGLVSGLLQAPTALPAVERLGLTSTTIDGFVAIVMPLVLGWGAGRLIDQSRERADQLRAILDVQRALSREASLDTGLAQAAEKIRATLGADRVSVVLSDASGEDVIVTDAPGRGQVDPDSAAARCLRSGRAVMLADLRPNLEAGGPSPVRGLVVPLDAGAGPLGVLALERAGDMPLPFRSAAEEIATHLALGIENVRLTVRQRRFTEELETKVDAATERLRELDRAKSEFLSVVAHELRTPLTALQGFSELLLERELPPERTTRFLRHLHAEAGRLGRIVTELLDLARIEAGRGLDLKPEAVNLAELIERNIDLFGAEHRGHRFEWSLSPDLPALSADRDAIDRILKNLLSNAVKYSPHGGRVGVVAGPAADQPGMIELSVEDDGVGIPAEDLPRIFDRYVRVANPQTASVRGLGLGLALVHGLAEAHGGRIEVESLPGKGSKFRLLLPIGQTQFLANFPNTSA